MKNKWLFSMLASAFLWGCTAVEAEFQKAKFVNTIPQYDEFLEAHPETEYTEEILFLKEVAFYDSVEGEKTDEAFSRYLENYPTGFFAKEAHEEKDRLFFEKSEQHRLQHARGCPSFLWSAPPLQRASCVLTQSVF